MDGIRTSKALAAALGEAAHEIAADHGDAAAQTITYALFLARVEPRERVTQLIEAFPDKAAVARVESVLDRAGLDAVFASYARECKDPAVYFHEEFARACDPAGSQKRGVHYSPPAVVSYIVRGVESILRSRFGLELSGATVLDPCCGIGAFLRHLDSRGHSARGFELTPSACELARCLLDRCEVVQADALTEVGSEKWEVGMRVSGFPLRSNPETTGPLVVIGNPPYSGHSANAGKIRDLMADYRAGLDERNPKWLQDDYVKFIRIAQHWVDEADRGIVAFITNHSFIFNPTFRAMRRSLMRSFDELYFLDLNGNKRLSQRTSSGVRGFSTALHSACRSGRTPESGAEAPQSTYRGPTDENVFPIKMGVAISFMVKIGDNRGRRIYHGSLRGSREEKLRALSEMDFDATLWAEVRPAKPFLLFILRDSDLEAEYARFPSLVDLFHKTSVGFVTSRDRFAIAFTRDELLQRVADLRDDRLSLDEVRARYPVGDLDVEPARRSLQQDMFWEGRAVEVLYRPFDRRWAYLSRAVMERPRLPFMGSMLRDNLAMAVGRAGHATGSREWDVVFCADCPVDLNLFRRGGAMIFPRWVYERGVRFSNIRLRDLDPDALFCYIYALLHSADYRARYRDFLMIDFPRIPIPPTDAFEALAALGEELIKWHRLKPAESASGMNIPDDQMLYDQRARIGGYEIPGRYLRDRRGRELTPDEQATFGQIRTALARTSLVRERIDQVVRANPPWV